MWKLDDVRHVPNLKKKKYLVSIDKLAKDGYVTTFAGDSWKISRGAMTIARGKKKVVLFT